MILVAPGAVWEVQESVARMALVSGKRAYKANKSDDSIDAYYAYTKMKSTIINYASTAESLKADDWFREGTGEVRYN